MVSSWLSHCVAVLGAAGQVAGLSYTLNKTYDASNFFDEFDFQTTGTITTQPDDNWSWVVYQAKSAAMGKGLAAIKNGQVYLGVDNTTPMSPDSQTGRPTLRLQSKSSFKHGLLITRFSHMPQPVCGGWPGYWTVGTGQWPHAGEIDLYEGWHLQPNNKVALHVGSAKDVGSCTLDQSSQTDTVLTGNCDNTYDNGVTQFLYQGCQSEEPANGIWGSPKGGVQALEWTQDFIKIYSWPSGSAPSNIGASSPDTSSWGTPSVQLKKSNCDTESAFSDQKILFTLPFCGNPPGNDQFWSQLPANGKSGATCKSITGEPSCVSYVAKNPQAFKNFYFQIQDVRYFTQAAVTSQLSLDTSSASLTFKYATSPASGDNWIGVWPYSDAQAPQSGSTIWAYAAQQSGSIRIQPTSSMKAGDYKAYLLSKDRKVLASIPKFTFAGNANQVAFSLQTRSTSSCGGSVNNDVSIPQGNGMCVNTNCNVGSLDISSVGNCPSGQVRISYWQNPNCAGQWYGYGYGSRGTCRSLWSNGGSFQSLWLSCADQKSDCVSQGTCKADPEPSVGVCSAAFHIKSHYNAGCTGGIHNDVSIAPGNGQCINTDCAVGSLDTAGAGTCPDGQLRISYWEQANCGGKWFGYGYASRNTCRTLWSNGWNFKSLWLSCAKQSDDCVSKGTCTADKPSSKSVC